VLLIHCLLPFSGVRKINALHIHLQVTLTCKSVLITTSSNTV
jgi:hypothetical protein